MILKVHRIDDKLIKNIIGEGLIIIVSKVVKTF